MASRDTGGASHQCPTLGSAPCAQQSPGPRTLACHVSDQAAPGVSPRALSAVWLSKCCCGCRLCRVCDCAANRLMMLFMLAQQLSRLWSFQRTVHAEHTIYHMNFVTRAGYGHVQAPDVHVTPDWSRSCQAICRVLAHTPRSVRLRLCARRCSSPSTTQ